MTFRSMVADAIILGYFVVITSGAESGVLLTHPDPENRSGPRSPGAEGCARSGSCLDSRSGRVVVRPEAIARDSSDAVFTETF